MEKKDFYALNEQLKWSLRRRSKNPAKNAAYLLIMCDGPGSAAYVEGNAWDLITTLNVLMDTNEDIGNIISAAAKIHALQGMRKGLEEIATLLEIDHEEPGIAPTDGN